MGVGIILPRAPGLDDDLVSIRPRLLFRDNPADFGRAFREVIVNNLVAELGGGCHFLRCGLFSDFDLFSCVTAALAHPPSQLGLRTRRDKDVGVAKTETCDESATLNLRSK